MTNPDQIQNHSMYSSTVADRANGLRMRAAARLVAAEAR
jgi:hypothetical protein